MDHLARLLADRGRGSKALTMAAESLELGSEPGDQHRMAALHTNLVDLLHADGQREGDGYRRASLSATRLRSTSAGDGRAWFRS